MSFKDFLIGLRDSFNEGVDQAFGRENRRKDVQADTRKRIRNILGQLGIDPDLQPQELRTALLAKLEDSNTSVHEIDKIRYILESKNNL